jgi:hypothetical protein
MNKRAIEMKILSKLRTSEREKNMQMRAHLFIIEPRLSRASRREREYSSNEFKWSRQRCLLDVAIYGRVH